MLRSFEFEFPGVFKKGANTVIYVILIVHEKKGSPRTNDLICVNSSSLIYEMGK